MPTGIATDATTQYFFKNLVENESISSLYDFENRKPLFQAVDSRYKFCLLTLVGRNSREPEAEFAFFANDPSDLERPGTRFTLTPAEITLLNPNTGTCPIFRTRRDAEITLGIYRRVPVLIREGDPQGNPWGVKFMQGLFNMTSDSHMFRTREALETDGWKLDGNVFTKDKRDMLPLYEGKMIHQFDSRWATFNPDGSSRDTTPVEKSDSNFVVQPRYWVSKAEVDGKLPGKLHGHRLAGYRWISNVTNERTLIAARFPYAAVGNSLPVILTEQDTSLLTAVMSTFVVDYCTRQKLGGQNMTFGTVSQLPIVSPESLNARPPWAIALLRDWISARVSLLYDPGFARDNYLAVRAELDAAFFHLYEIERDDVDYIMETFPIFKRKDTAEHGEYRTKRLVLEIYDEMAQAEAAGIPYASPFDEVHKQ